MNSVNDNAIDKSTDKPLHLTKRIGSTTYKVSVHFSRTSRETMGDKIMRLIEKEAVNTPGFLQLNLLTKVKYFSAGFKIILYLFSKCSYIQHHLLEPDDS